MLNNQEKFWFYQRFQCINTLRIRTTKVKKLKISKLLREAINFYMFKIGNYGGPSQMTSRVFLRSLINK